MSILLTDDELDQVWGFVGPRKWEYVAVTWDDVEKLKQATLRKVAEWLRRHNAAEFTTDIAPENLLLLKDDYKQLRREAGLEG